MNKYLFASLFTLFCIYSNAQNIKSIVSTRTYFYPDSTPPTIIDSNLVMLFDSQERLIRQDDIEGVCYQKYAYDKAGKMIINNNYCGEGFMECTYTYKKNIRIEECFSSVSEYYTYDSLNARGLPIKSIYQVKQNSFEYEDSLVTETYTYYFEYDEQGHEISKKELNKKGEITHRVTRKYNEKGLLTSFASFGEKGIKQDSILYFYDWADRLYEVKRFQDFKTGGDYSLNSVLSIQYASLNKPNKQDQIFNDTLIHQHLFYSFKYLDVRFSVQPVIISLKINDKNDSTNYQNLDLTFKYNYDDKARLIEITGEGTYDANEKTLSIENQIAYTGKNKAKLTLMGEDHYGYSAKGNTFEYENGLLIKSTEKAKDGFIVATDVYRYTFYK